MVKITWLGEDQGDTPGPSFNVWNGIRFPKGEAVEVSDPHMIAKARNHALYKVMETGGVAGKAGSPTPDQKPKEAPVAKAPEKKVEAKVAPKVAAKVETKPAAKEPGKKDPHDYPPVKKAPKKQVRKPAARHVSAR